MRWKQVRYFDSSDADNPHPWYGPCDMMGPDLTCCECQGLMGHPDGSVSVLRTGEVVRKAPLTTRLRRAWAALTS